MDCNNSDQTAHIKDLIRHLHAPLSMLADLQSVLDGMNSEGIEQYPLTAHTMSLYLFWYTFVVGF